MKILSLPKTILPLLALAALSTGLQAATIANFSFQSNVNPDATGRFGFGESRDFNADGTVGTADAGGANNIIGWTTVTTQNTTPAGAQLSVGFINITPANGSQALSLQSGASTKQFTSTTWASLTAGDQITMTVAVGDRLASSGTVWADQSFFAIIDGATTGILTDGSLRTNSVANSGELATPFAGGTGIDGGTMQDRSFSYTVLASDLTRSGNVGVLLAGYGSTGTGDGTTNATNQAFFDNVRLVIIPEPSSALLGCLGGLLLLRRRR